MVLRSEPVASRVVVPGPRLVGPASFVRCRTAGSLAQAYHGIVDDLVAAGFDLPSVYVLVGQRLRCEAARGYFQVVDGFRSGTGIIGTVVETGRPVLVEDVTTRPDFIAAVPGLVAEACAPVRSGGQVVGALSVESRDALPPDTAELLGRAAEALGQRMDALGGLPAPSLAQRVAQAAAELTAASSVQEVQQRALGAAVELSGKSTAVLTRRGPDGDPRVCASVGPLAAAIRRWTPGQLALVGSWVSADTSSHFPGGDESPPEYAFLREAGLRATSVHPLVVRGEVSGHLLLASSRPVPHATAVADCLDLLAAQTAAALSAADLLAEMSLRARKDDLTGLGNRSTLHTAVAEAVAASVASTGRMAVLLVDLDGFKQVNDRLGHHAGDQLLQAVAGRIASGLRPDDAALRLGGDEFAIVLARATVDSAVAAAERLLASLAEVPAGDGRCSASIGVVVHEGPAQATELLRAADAAMYAAKGRGKGRCEVWTADMLPGRALRRA